MTGRRRNRSTFLPTFTRPVRATVMSAAALGACASLVAGCGVIPGVTGGAGDGSITVMTWAPWDTSATNKPGMPAMATAYAKWINKHGGINGRKLKVLTCNDHNSSVSAATCARLAVKEDVVAVVGSYSEFSDSYFAPLEGAGIPYIGGYGVTTEEFTRALSYPVNGGQPALLAGLGKELATTCGPVTLVRPDSIAGDDLPPLLNAGLAAGGHAPATDQLAADDATEYASQSVSALKSASGGSGKEGCVVPSLGDRTDTFMDSFRRDRQDYPAVHAATVLGSVDQTEINSTGGQSGPYEGSYITGWYPVASDARWNPMKKAVDEVAFGDNRIDPADAGVQTTWIAYTAFKTVVNSLGSGDITADTVRRALDDGVKVDTGGLTPTLQWSSRDDNLASVGLARLVNANVTLQVVRKGVLVSAKKGFLDMTGTLGGADLN